MSENTVYTLAKTLQKTDGLEKDFAQMLSALRDTVEKEYLLKIRSAANAETAFAKELPRRRSHCCARFPPLWMRADGHSWTA